MTLLRPALVGIIVTTLIAVSSASAGIFCRSRGCCPMVQRCYCEESCCYETCAAKATAPQSMPEKVQYLQDDVRKLQNQYDELDTRVKRLELPATKSGMPRQ